MSPLQTLLAGMPAGSIKADDLLGFLTMFSVPDRMTDLAAITYEWDRLGLAEDLKPAPTKPLDTFALACAAVATSRNNEAGESVLVKRASTDGTAYQITRELRDDLNRIVEYPKAMTLEFKPDTEHLTVIMREDYEVLRKLEERVRDNYHAYRGQVSGRKVRGAVRETIVDKLGGTNYMGKGVYLVPREGLRVLEALRDMLGAIYNGDAPVVMIPMLNTKPNKEDLSRFHADEIRERCEALMGTIGAKLRSGGTVRSDMLANVLKQNGEIKAQRDRIMDLVGRETQAVEDQLDLLKAQIEALMDLDSKQAVAA